MEYMAGLPDKAFELAIVDPPYGIGAGKMGLGKGGGVAKSGNYEKKDWDKSAPKLEYFLELKRVSKNQIIWGANHFLGWVGSGWVVWDKLNGDTDYADCELAYSSFDRPVRKFSFKWMGMLQQDMKNKEDRIHPTQKPVALYKWLLHNYAKPGDKILDTHGGSRSLAIACHQMGFNHVSCEIDLDYHNDSVKRFKEQTMQQDLFKQAV
jgi:site-specific DNA-methyltransferase (adenine-specific)